MICDCLEKYAKKALSLGQLEYPHWCGTPRVHGGNPFSEPCPETYFHVVLTHTNGPSSPRRYSRLTVAWDYCPFCGVSLKEADHG